MRDCLMEANYSRGSHAMEAEKSLTFRLETYLVQLADINRRWTVWLNDCELGVLERSNPRQQPSGLLVNGEEAPENHPLGSTAKSLFAELQQVIEDRKQILADARQAGLVAVDLTELARLLPAWDKPALRQSLLVARSQMANLRRLHVATWVLISQAFHFYNDTLQMLMVGSTPHVYQHGRQTDLGGGRLLDASL